MEGRLKEEERSYYRRVEGILEGGEGEEEVFLPNVVDQVLSDNAVRVCCDKEASRVVEQVIYHSELKGRELLRLTGALTENYRKLALHRCGSHVAESLAKVVASNLTECDGLEPLLLSVCATLQEHLSEFIVHPYGSHVLSCLLQALAGVDLGEDASRSRYSREFRKAKMHGVKAGRGGRKVASVDSNLKLLDGFGRRVSKLPELSEVIVHECGSPVLQVLLRVLTQQVPARGEKLIKKILRCSDLLTVPQEEGALPAIFTDTNIFDNCFKKRAMTFALHPVANYLLQQLIASASPDQVSELMAELCPLEDILFVGHSGVVLKLVERVAMFCPDHQPTLLDTLLTAFHTQSTPRSCAPLFLSLMAYEAYYGEPSEGGERVETELMINTVGSLLVQSLLKFQDPKLIVSSIMRMAVDDIIRVSCDPAGCHVMEAFMESISVTVKRKYKLLERLKPALVPLCTDKHGSRVMDAVWRTCDVGKKESLAQEMLAHEDKLNSNFYGRIVLHNCNLSHYKRKQAAWKDQERGVARRRDIFRDILCEEEPPQRKKHKMSATSNVTLA